MKRRTFLSSGAAAIAGLSTHSANAQYAPPLQQPSTTGVGMPLSATDLNSAVARLRGRFAKEFDPAYIDNVILPHFLASIYDGERLALPMIDVGSPRRTRCPTISGVC